MLLLSVWAAGIISQPLCAGNKGVKAGTWRAMGLLALMLDKSQVVCPSPSCQTHTLVFHTTCSNPGWVTLRLKVILAAVAQHRDYKRYFIIRVLYRRAAQQSGCSRQIPEESRWHVWLLPAICRAWPYLAMPTSPGAAGHGSLCTWPAAHNSPYQPCYSPAKSSHWTHWTFQQYFKEFSNSTQSKQITILNIDSGMEAWVLGASSDLDYLLCY